MNNEVIKDTSRLSNCCGAPMYSESDICSDCKEHSGTEEQDDIQENTDTLEEKLEALTNL